MMTNEEFRRSFKVPYHNSLGLAVYSCGVQHCGSCHSWGPAVRDHYLIHYILSGRGTFSYSGKKYNLSAGDGFLVVPSKVVYYCSDENDPWEYCWVGFNGSDAKRLMGYTGLLNKPPVFHYSDDNSFETIIMSICNASGTKPSDEMRMESGLLLFLATLTDKFGEKETSNTNGYEYVQKAIKFIEYNYSSDISVNDIASSVGSSRSHLYRIFMQNISIPPNEYLMRYRVNKACELLQNHNLSIGEVAYSAGFADQLYFSRVFKKYMGMPPSKFSEYNSKGEYYV